MAIRRNCAINQLKIVTQADEMCAAIGVMQKTVIETFAVTDPMTGQIKTDPRDNNQVSFVSSMIGSG